MDRLEELSTCFHKYIAKDMYKEKYIITYDYVADNVQPIKSFLACLLMMLNQSEAQCQ